MMDHRPVLWPVRAGDVSAQWAVEDEIACLPGGAPVPVDGLGPARLAVLRRCAPGGYDQRVQPLLVEAAARVWARTPIRTVQGDRRAMTVLMDMLAEETAAHGSVDVRRALRRESVDRWLSRAPAPQLVGGLRVMLYTAGRVLYPRDYPALQVAPAITGTCVAADKDLLQEMYALAEEFPETLSWPLALMLDLCAGAGLRADELDRVLGSDIAALPLAGAPAVAVTVRSRTARVRTVPVVQPQTVQRLRAAAECAGPRRLFAPWIRCAEGDSIQDFIAAELRRRGYPMLTAAALRSRWFSNLAGLIDLGVLLQLAGAEQVRVLTGPPTYVPMPELALIAAILVQHSS